jgi:hypothetical protein
MCDYSLGGLPNRLAVEGEELAVHKFMTGSKGLVSSKDLRAPDQSPISTAGKNWWERFLIFVNGPVLVRDAPAVCVPPGATLVVKDIPRDLQERWCLNGREVVRFIQTSARENCYRDAIQFESGKQVLLQELRTGLRVDVLSMGDTADTYEPNLSEMAH